MKKHTIELEIPHCYVRMTGTVIFPAAPNGVTRDGMIVCVSPHEAADLVHRRKAVALTDAELEGIDLDSIPASGTVDDPSELRRQVRER